MARRPKLVLRKAERGIDLPATDRADLSQLHHLSDFLAWGTITIGHVDRAGAVAIAAEGKHVYVMLRRFPDENLDQTLIRLDQAIGRVFNELVYIDEVNPISKSTHYILVVSTTRHRGHNQVTQLHTSVPNQRRPENHAY